MLNTIQLPEWVAKYEGGSKIKLQIETSLEATAACITFRSKQQPPEVLKSILAVEYQCHLGDSVTQNKMHTVHIENVVSSSWRHVEAGGTSTHPGCVNSESKSVREATDWTHETCVQRFHVFWKWKGFTFRRLQPVYIATRPEHC